MSLTSLEVEICCTNSKRMDEMVSQPMDNSGDKCASYWREGYRRHCYTETALQHEDLRQRVLDCMRAIPTLRRMALFWTRCQARCPTHVIVIDLIDPSHTCDRPGRESDGTHRTGYVW